MSAEEGEVLDFGKIMNFSIPENQEKLTKWGRLAAAEFLGTALVVFCATEKAALASGAPEEPAVITTALASGFSLAAVIYSLARISGGHVNPAVTWAMVISGQTPVLQGVMYFVAQLLGGITGSGLLAWFAGIKNFQGVLKLAEGVTPSEGFGTEAFLTFFFVFIIFNLVVYADRHINTAVGIDRQRALAREAMAPFMIGLTLVTAYLVAGPITGSGINPARAFGPACIGRNFTNHWVYWFGPIFGATVAPPMFFVMRSDIPKYQFEDEKVANSPHVDFEDFDEKKEEKKEEKKAEPEFKP